MDRLRAKERNEMPPGLAASAARSGQIKEWERVLRERLPLYGHRNWIVVADSAYPAQARAGIETIVSGADQLAVLQTVLTAVADSKQVKAIVYTDAELRFVDEKDAPDIVAYRNRLAALFGTSEVRVLPHEQIIAKLDNAAEMFRVLIIKTNMAVPYTSVFLELDCRYWNAAAESKLRSAISAQPK
jgi:RbsD / FucU transport protein family